MAVKMLILQEPADRHPCVTVPSLSRTLTELPKQRKKVLLLWMCRVSGGTCSLSGHHLKTLGMCILCGRLKLLLSPVTCKYNHLPMISASKSLFAVVSNFQTVTNPAAASNLQLMSPSAAVYSYLQVNCLRTLTILAAHVRATHTQATRRLSKSFHRIADSHGLRAKLTLLNYN
ncbi:hypothetical protein J6590_035485 [Homalodisca vitripennis]|nr:hypothetical protein J6590_035485 [Homalodisca vitripennis]